MTDAEKVKELRKRLKEIEFVPAPGRGDYNSIEACPVCKEEWEHKDDCWLDKELKNGD